MDDEVFHLIDERDIDREATADTFRVSFWHGDENDPQDLTSVAVYETSVATLDEVIAWAKRGQIPEPRLVEIFAVVASAEQKDSIQIASYDHRPDLKPGEVRDTGYSEASIFLHG
ncbi:MULTISPECIES: hypothetical protein [Brevibacterium]|uniref:Uncharacterized protein n=2 Tax=Brevibacterium TaxID=1696 RepID=A0A2A3ZMA3_BREAU|nr:MULTISPECIES: hypothetical protein [Brevibacterium]AZL06612.1 hypothetical protein CXR24_14255 [Brevibacterium aurantiacum]AZL10198.1 hypothetical protein CXR26_13945 [Brevibacterium aurantiacum]AZT94418.1 hypothetical protein CXR23_15745 [Brevibacterium aurantiacum]AZT98183.1 hypothetical protein CXR27_15160 [Brevibacterium aurantiacum]MCI4012408.1 hypothetical protein [Brevibacterium sp. ZH18]